MIKATKEKLLGLGFEESKFEGEKCFRINLEKGSDRFHHSLRWYEDEPDKFYIDEVLISKVKTISEKDFLRNHNGFSTNAVNCYMEIIENLES